jgi:hypothetical protein
MFKTTGLDKIQRQFTALRRRTESLSRQRSVPLRDLLTPSFLRRCSRFTSFDDLCRSSGFKTETQADFEAIPNRDWDAFIRKETSFRTWKAMLDSAAAEYAKGKLGL